ncbi:MAG: NAD-dependent epimerase/dehydratase family protein [Verrucomicrobia bacterium]|nr:MAG: NAD-dependent epimerase/dehydratase family protein [Verrucomicrobiota bacterium]
MQFHEGVLNLRRDMIGNLVCCTNRVKMTVLNQDLREILDRTRPLWEELKGGRLFITGGTGFFGRWLLESFLFANRSLRLNAKAVVLTRNPENFHRIAPELAGSPLITLVVGDVTGFRIPRGSFTHLIHAASELSVANPKNPLGLIETTLTGLRRVLELGKNSGASKLLFTSSGAVYGPMVEGRWMISEKSPVSALTLDARGAYPEAKRLAELVSCISGKEHGLDVKIARGFAFIGPFLPLDSHLAAACFLRSALDGNPIAIKGHGKTIRSYLYGADLAVWLWTILFKGQPAEPYNLGSDIPVTIAELAQQISGTSAASVEVQVLGQARDGELIDVYLPDISKAKHELGLDVFTPLPEAIRRTMLSHANNNKKS